MILNKRYPFFTLVLLAGSWLANTGCVRQNEILDTGKAYIRVINITNANTRFYLDDIVNVNGDTAVYDFQGNLYRNITTDYKPLLPPLRGGSRNEPGILVSLGRYVDLNRQDSIGVYKFSLEQESYFPNSTHRVNTGKIINGITYYNANIRFINL